MKSYALHMPFASCTAVKTPERRLSLQPSLRRAKQRPLPSSLGVRLLLDIGINPLDAAHESSKKFWQN